MYMHLSKWCCLSLLHQKIMQLFVFYLSFSSSSMLASSCPALLECGNWLVVSNLLVRLLSSATNDSILTGKLSLGFIAFINLDFFWSNMLSSQVLLMHISLALLTFICLNSIQNIFKILSYFNQFFLLSIYNEAFCYRMPSSLDFSSPQDRAYSQNQIKNIFLTNAFLENSGIYCLMHSFVFHLFHNFWQIVRQTLEHQCPLFF